jgi:hypothetical protein
MNEEIVKRFLYKQIRLVTNGHSILGEITELQDDCIIFKSKKAISAISLDAIESIILLG